MTLAAVLLAATLIGGATPAEPDDATFRVILAECKDLKPLADAHVMILAQDGKVLSEGVTNANGQVDLRRPADQENAAFIFAEHPRFFMGGVRWDRRFKERFISMAWLAGL